MILCFVLFSPWWSIYNFGNLGIELCFDPHRHWGFYLCKFESVYHNDDICHFDLNRNSITISEESDFLNISTCFTLNSGAFILTTLDLHFNRIIHATYNHNYISIPSSWECFIFYFLHCSLYKSLESQALFIVRSVQNSVLYRFDFHMLHYIVLLISRIALFYLFRN